MRLLWLVDSLRSVGLNVVPVSGWEARGRALGYDPRLIVDHHTAGGVGSNAPSLDICTHGRKGPNPVVGPLCNILTGRDGTVFVIASGISNNAGEGGYPRLGASHNRHTIGHEVEHAGRLDLERINLDQLEVVALVDAVICREMRWDATHCVAHKEWAPGRKTDPIWSQDDHVGRVANLLNPPARPDPPGGHMAAVLTMTEISRYVNDCYDAAEREPGSDLPGRRFWVAEASKAADPWPTLDYMWGLLAPGK